MDRIIIAEKRRRIADPAPSARDKLADGRLLTEDGRRKTGFAGKHSSLPLPLQGEAGRGSFCGGPIELDTYWGVVRETPQLAEFESATKRSQTQPGSDNPKQSEFAWSCIHLQ